MSPVKICSALLVLSLALASSGCFGGGGDGGKGRTASRGNRFTSGKKKQDQASKGRGKGKNRQQPGRKGANDLESLSPEGSIQRDLAMLKERESNQVRVVQEMREALVQGEEMVRKEEVKLASIQDQINRFDSALASGNYRQNNRGGMPANMYQAPDNPYRQNNQRPDSRSMASRGPDYERSGVAPASYARDDREYMTVNPSPRGGQNRGGYAQEEVLYRQPQQSARPESNYYRQDERRAPNDTWVAEDRLFTSNNEPQRPAGPRANTLSRMQPVRPEPVDTGTSYPAAGATTQPRSGAPMRDAAPQARSNPADDEVFTPDMYLSGGR